ncbi:MBL fold metallo-hydrolase [Leminorella grimontii]|uniref:MBL fold metallo-hydrolase n=1 Tax=Leminorella grimontii TaxID=82981 RepID=UPI00321F724E
MKKYASRALLALLMAGCAMAAQASAPAKQETQVPGYYRMPLGQFEVTALYDGYVKLGTNLLKDINAKDAKTLLDKMYVNSDNGVQTAVNAFLINTGEHLVLVDSGAAKCFGPTLGAIKSNLTASGYKPEQVDTVLLTHLHADHVCGITDNGAMAFPNATVYVAKADADYWLSPEQAAKAPEAAKPMFATIQAAVAPYQAAGKFKVYQPGDSLQKGISVMPTPGHTPGHSSYLFTSGEQGLLVWGDIVHSHSVQFTRPEVSMEFDVDNKKAVETRRKLFANIAKTDLWIAGAHLPFPGIGHVGADAQGYRWVPVEYSPFK